MTIDEIIIKLSAIEEMLKKKHPSLASDDEKAVLARAVKLNEEVGELMEEVLLKYGYQRQDKIDNHDKDNTAKELGDVFNTLILLGISLDIDVKKAIEDRVEEMYHKYGLELQ